MGSLTPICKSKSGCAGSEVMMARFQLVEFLRKPPKAILKSDVKWERGIAKLDDTEDVQFILDENGKKIPEPHRFRKLLAQGFSVIDTETSPYMYE